MKVSWFDSNEDFENGIITSIVFKQDDFFGVDMAIDARRLYGKG